MAERTTGWRAILSRPLVYETAQRAIGSPRVRRTLVETYLKPEPGQSVLDIGCGPGDMVTYFDGLDYVGYDASESYIASARSRYGDRGTFVVGLVGEHDEEQRFDLAFAKGVVHHLDDEPAARLYKSAHTALKPGGRLVTMDPCYAAGQSRAARYVASKDRGQNVRTVDEYAALAQGAFDGVETAVHHGLLRIPISHGVVICTR